MLPQVNDVSTGKLYKSIDMKIEVSHNGRVFRLPKWYWGLCEKVKQRPDFSELEKTHRERTEKHIQSVIEYSQRFRILSQTFANHDADKLNENSIIYVPYVLVTLKYKDKEKLSERENLLTNIGTFIHVKSNPHHPEYRDRNMTFSNFDRDETREITNGSKMQVFEIMEMCCDWCAMSKELGGSPFDWFEKNNGTRWSFTEEQVASIQHNLGRAWMT